MQMQKENPSAGGRNFIKIFLAIFLLGFCLVQDANAEVSISNLIGTVSDGQQIDIVGNSFGIKNSPAPQLWDTVDNQNTYNGLADMDNVPTTVYELTNNVFPTKYTTSRAQRGFRTAHYYTHGYKASVGWPKNGVGSMDKLYFTFWIKTNMSSFKVDGSPIGTNKFVRIWDDKNGVGTRISFTEYVTTWPILDEGANGGGGTFCYPRPMQIGAWNRVEVSVDATNHSVKMYLNRILMSDGNNFIKYSGTSLPLIPGHIGFDNSGTSYVNPPALDFENLDTDFGEIYVDNAFSRVEICNGNTLASSTHCEIQPVTTWSDNNISFSLNQGTFINGETAYLYVIDENGNQNANGVPIIIGSSAGLAYSISNFTTLVSNWLHVENISDINFDNVVNTKDLGIMMSKWQ